MTEKFVDLLASRFGSELRRRGSQYHRAGRVELLELTEDLAVAQVEGSEVYAVRIEHYRAPRRIAMQCECPHFRDRGPCKHLWATLLAIDEIEQGIRAVEVAHAGGDAVAEPEPKVPRPARVPAKPTPIPPTPIQNPPSPGWQSRLEHLLPAGLGAAPAVPCLEFEVRIGSHDLAAMELAVFARFPTKSGELGGRRRGTLSGPLVQRLSAVEQDLLQLLQSSGSGSYHGHGYWQNVDLESLGQVSLPLLPRVLELLAAHGRVEFGQIGSPPRRLSIDAAEPFRFELALEAPADSAASTATVAVTGIWRRRDERLPLATFGVVERAVAVLGDRLVRCERGVSGGLAADLLRRGAIRLPAADLPVLLRQLARLPGAAAFLGELIERLPSVAPTPVLLVDLPKAADAPLPARLRFDYDGELLAAAEATPLLTGAAGVVRRDFGAEQAARAQLAALHPATLGDALVLSRERLVPLTAALTAAGFRVLAAGRRLRALHRGQVGLTSGVDWFDLQGAFEFGSVSATLPELLRHKITPDGLVELADGSHGVLPTTWLRRLETLRLLGGTTDDDLVRLPWSQGLLLDALLSARTDDDAFVVDARFRALRQRLEAFTRVQPSDEPAGFRGELRPYQREGLGWLRFLREFGLGGCLADDMGLGKTVQVLALLVDGRGGKRRGKVRPSLLVAPRSVLGNWLAESAKFAPGLRVLDFSTPDRWRDGADERLADCDLVLTTYALLRTDAPQFAERGQQFVWAILDEAQAVKNADSQAAKAVRLLAARHRLVLTGTPVENHLGDLWSLFEFLNPGMLGRLPAFRELFGKDATDEAMDDNRQLVQRALRPVLLRRTKAQVLRDLPDKVEQTLWCELEPSQRKRYDALREHYRARLLAGPGEIDAQERFVVLEALLRLRQAACHERLLDPRSKVAASAKFAELLPRLEELAAEGHKALVFSQFTSLLDLLEPELRERGLVFERLDGSTTKRAPRIERFQNDPKCPLFLISLKAGGYGLNLTAADYVFLLDPWWNPAVEMQAIDRAHRIGQRRTVNAYRLVCRGTVEERVLELQAKKRELCEAILGNARSVLQDLTRADLELLLG